MAGAGTTADLLASSIVQARLPMLDACAAIAIAMNYGRIGDVALVVYHYPHCSTCKKALGWLRTHAVDFEPIDIVKQPPARAVIERAAKLAGVPTKKLFNVSGESYRAGNYKDKLATMTDAQAYAALAADGKLIKRPLAVDKDIALVGFDEAAWRAALG